MLILSVAKRTTLRDEILFYADEFMDDPDYLRIFVLSDIIFQRYLLYTFLSTASLLILAKYVRFPIKLLVYQHNQRRNCWLQFRNTHVRTVKLPRVRP